MLVSGAVAEKNKIRWLLCFSQFFMYGLDFNYRFSTWKWGDGFLDAMGFSAVLMVLPKYSVGGWGALGSNGLFGCKNGKFGDFDGNEG